MLGVQIFHEANAGKQASKNKKKIYWKNLAYLGQLTTKNFKSKIIVAF